MSDMSCHQVVSSKNSDDPYIFRDTPVTTSVYSSQLGRLTPIRLNQLNQQQVLPKYSQSIQPQQQQQQQQQLSPRINGNLSLVNGYHNNQIPTTISSSLIKTQQNLQKFIVKHKSLPLPSSPTSSSAPLSCSSPTSLVTTTRTTISHQPQVTATNHQINQNNFLQQYQQQQLHQQQIINQPEQVQQQQQVIISKLPPPLYHNSHNTLINHSTGGGGGGGLSGSGSNGGGVTRIIIGQQQPQHQQQTQKLPHHSNSPLKRVNSFADRVTEIKPSINNLSSGILLGSSIPPPGAAILGGKSIKNENSQGGVLLPIKIENDLSRVSAASFSIPKTIGIGKKSLPSVVVTQTAAQSPVLPVYNRSIIRSCSQASSSQHTNNDHPRISSRLSNISTSHHIPPSNEWHSPGAYIFDYMGPGATKLEAIELAGCIQTHWFTEYFGEDEIINREQKLEIKKSILRRQAIQYLRSQKLRSNMGAKRRLLYVSKALNKLKIKEEEPPQPQRCCISNCSNDALALTAFCHLHITHNTDQMLFHPCTAKFSDNSPCRVPVFDISHELPLCREHAWKRDNYDRMIQEQKPKKPPRKKPKPSAMTRPPKRNKKKKKPPAIVQQVITHQIHQSVHPNQQILQNKIQVQQQSQIQQYQHHQPQQPQHHHHNLQNNTISLYSKSLFSHQNLASAISALQQNQHMNLNLNQKNAFISVNTQDMLSVCENSSAYESSEDTGVGGLSESELINHDVIEIPLGDTRLLEEHDLTNVLNQIPEETFNEFLSVEQNSPFEPTQEEKEDLERALEAVDEQVKSLQQITGSDFLDDFLDDPILDDTDICEDVLVQTTGGTSEIRGGLVHT